MKTVPVGLGQFLKKEDSSGRMKTVLEDEKYFRRTNQRFCLLQPFGKVYLLNRSTKEEVAEIRAIKVDSSATFINRIY